MVWVYCLCMKLALFQTDLPPLLICDAVARYVLGLGTLKGGRVCSGMKPLSHLVLHKCYFFSFSWDSRACFALTHRNYFWSGWVIPVQSSEMVSERLWAGGGMFPAELSPGERREHLRMGTPYSFLFTFFLFTLAAETEEGDFPLFAVTGYLSNGTGSSKYTLYYHYVKYNPDVPLLQSPGL